MALVYRERYISLLVMFVHQFLCETKPKPDQSKNDFIFYLLCFAVLYPHSVKSHYNFLSLKTKSVEGRSCAIVIKKNQK